MIIFRTAQAISDFLRRNQSKTIGFVPTMGALHAGHLSLIEKAAKENEIVICSIFVNPAQFSDASDLKNYPRPIEKDIALLSATLCDLLFLPDEKEIYPRGREKLQHYDLNGLDRQLEGGSRPGHFQGVANVIDNFLEIIKPQRLYLGQKDFQQVKVIERLIELLKSEVKVIMCPVVREENGLAMSSRNIRLNDEQKRNASGISKSLFFIRDHQYELSLPELKRAALQKLSIIPGAEVDYIEFCDTKSFKIINDSKEGKGTVVVVAVKIADVRLLDNVILN